MNRRRAGAYALAAVGVAFIASAAHGAHILATGRDLLAGRSHLVPVDYEPPPGDDDLYAAYDRLNGDTS